LLVIDVNIVDYICVNSIAWCVITWKQRRTRASIHHHDLTVSRPSLTKMHHQPSGVSY